MKKITIVSPLNGVLYNMKDEILKYATEMSCCVDFIFRDKTLKQDLNEKIRNLGTDILITENLEGFELSTLTDSVLYNLMNCRQFHFIFNSDLDNERFLNMPMSLRMTFVFKDKEMRERFCKLFPDLPDTDVWSENSLIAAFNSCVGKM